MLGRLALLLTLLLAAVPGTARAAAIAHAFREATTQHATASTAYVDVTNAALASDWSDATRSSGTGFTAGKKYLIYATAQMSHADGGSVIRVKTLHGTTDFLESEALFRSGSINENGTYVFLTVWTAVSGEGIKLQFRSSTASFNAQIDQVALLAINLSDDVTENADWFFAESATDAGLNIAFADGASVTFTPGTAGQDWLTLSYVQMDPTVATASLITRINRDDTDLTPESRVEAISAADQHVFGLARVFSLTAASHTIKEQSASTVDATNTRLHSSIFVLNLNKFKNHANAYTAAAVALSATDYATELQTVSLTPAVAGNVWIGGQWSFDRQQSARTAKFRVQVDGADEPAGQTTDAYVFDLGGDTTDEDPLILSTLPNLTAAAHTIDLDASASSVTDAPAGQHRTLWAVTMELAAAAAAAAPERAKMGVGR